jgi:MSHA biogenesis protein MshI
MVLDAGASEVAAVHGESASAGKPHVHQFAVRASDEPAAGLQRIGRELSLSRFRCATLLDPADYQIMLVDAPNVPRDELKTAMRWRVKDLLDFHIDDVTLDVLDIPVTDEGPARNHSMYAIAARNEAIQARIKQFEGAGIGLSVIDIPETAQRNVAALYEEPNRSLATLYFNETSGLLTVNYQTELYLARRFDVSIAEVTASDEQAHADTHSRILLELQRSLDHFERQFRAIPIAKLLLGPEPTPSGLAQYLAEGLGIRVQSIDMNEAMAVAGGSMDARLQWRLFHLVGASLRREQVAL